MTDQVWDWKAELDPFELSRVRALDREIRKLDDSRVLLAAERATLVARGRTRARNKQSAARRSHQIAGDCRLNQRT